MRALVTKAESTGLFVTRSLGKHGIEVTTASHKGKAITFHSKYCAHRAYYPNPKKYGDKIVGYMLSLIKKLKIDMFFPLSEEIMIPISQNIEKFDGNIINIPSYDAIEATDDKSKTVETAIENGMGVPKTFLMRNRDEIDTAARELDFPVVIKPYRGEGSVGHSIMNTPDGLKAKFQETVSGFGPSMIQELIRGKKYTVSAVFNEKHRPVRSCVQTMVRQFPLAGGPQVVAESVIEPTVMEFGLDYLRALRWNGIGQVEIIVDERDNKPKLIEVNPRFYGSVCLPIAAGVDYPWILWRMAMGEKIKPDLTYRTGVRARLLFPNDFQHLFSVLAGGPKVSGFQNPSRLKILINFLKFYGKDTHYFFFSRDDPMPGIYNMVNCVYNNVTKML
jgi:predicted ATP-grasp superfamily ATP-dependent carboligase